MEKRGRESKKIRSGKIIQIDDQSWKWIVRCKKGKYVCLRFFLRFVLLPSVLLPSADIGIHSSLICGPNSIVESCAIPIMDSQCNQSCKLCAGVSEIMWNQTKGCYKKIS